MALPLVYIIGDSISMQYGPHLEKFLAGKWRYDRKRGEPGMQYSLDNPAGANGGDSAMVLAFLQATAATAHFQPDILLINCGLHDIKLAPGATVQQIPLPDYEKNLRAIVQLARDRRTPLAWIQTTHVSDEMHNVKNKPPFQRFEKDRAAYDEAACRIMRENGVPVIDLATFTRNLGPDDEIFCDHVHFHESVREKQGAFLAGWLDAWRGLKS